MAASQFVLQVNSFMCRMSFNINFLLKWQVMLFMQLHFLGNVDFLYPLEPKQNSE